MVELVLSKGVSIRPKGCTSFCKAWMIISFGQIANQADRPGHICVYGWVISSWNPLFQTPAYTSLAVMYFEGRCIVWPFKTLIPWLRRGFCPVSNLTARYAEVLDSKAQPIWKLVSTQPIIPLLYWTYWTRLYLTHVCCKIKKGLAFFD